MKGGCKRGNFMDSLPIRVGDDVVRLILSICDSVQAIVVFSQSSKHAHRLVFSSREIWLSAARRLHSRGYLDIAPDQQLSQLSLDQLLFLIKRIAISSNEEQVPTLPLLTVSLSIPSTEPLFEAVEAVLANSGEYVVLADRLMPGVNLSCWSMKTKALVWDSRDQPGLIGDYVKIVRFTTRASHSKRLDVLICLRHPLSQPDDIFADYFVQLWHINLADKSVQVVDLLEYQPHPGSKLFAHDFEIEDDLKLCLNEEYAVVHGMEQLVIYNQSSKKHMRFHIGQGGVQNGCAFGFPGTLQDEVEDEDGEGEETQEVVSLHLLGGLLFLGLLLANGTHFRTLIWDIQAVDKQWTSDTSVNIHDVPSLQSVDLEEGWRMLACYRSPFTDDICYLDMLFWTKQMSVEIRRHKVSLAQQGELVVEKIGTLIHGLNPHNREIRNNFSPFAPEKRSFACIKNGTCLDDFPPLDGDPKEGAGIAYRSPYSRTVVHVKERKITVIYYG